MVGLPNKAKVYLSIVIPAGLFLLGYYVWQLSVHPVDWLALGFFMLLIMLAETLMVPLPRGGFVSVSFAVILAVIILLGPEAASVATAVAVTVAPKKSAGSKSLTKYLFNIAQDAPAIGAGGYLYQALGGVTGQVDLYAVVPILGAAVTYFVVNSLAVSLILALAQQKPVGSTLLFNLRGHIVNMLALIPLGLLIAVLFRDIGYTGVILLFGPLLIARHAFTLYTQMRTTYVETIQSLSKAIDAKDRYTKGHSERVARYSVAVARHMKLPEQQIEALEYMAILHDTGKIGISDRVLNKPGKLEMEEFEAMKKHPLIGEKIIEDIKFLAESRKVVRHHHERWDGLGYPDGLKGEDIPLGARIIAVADAFDAMTSDRPYRRALPVEAAMRELKRCAGTQFDPKVVRAFLEVFPTLGIVSPATDPELDKPNLEVKKSFGNQIDSRNSQKGDMVNAN